MADHENVINGEIQSIGSISGSVSTRGEISGSVESEGEISAELAPAKRYYDDDYEKLRNLPAINGHTLIGDQTAAELEIEAALKAELDVTKAVGGLVNGTNYPQGTLLESIIRDMLNPVEYPALVNPSASISATGTKLLEKGDVLNTVVTVSFNRGQINPAYGTSGYRSGPATSYSLNGGTPQPVNSFFATIDETNDSLQSEVTYSAGEQPKNSIGEDYDHPLPAGYVNSNTITYEFVNALWANTANIQVVAKQALVSFSAKIKEFTFPEQTALYPEIFDVPSTWNVTAIEVLNTLSGQWESVVGEFNTSTVQHDDAGGTATTYTRYTDNRGYNAGSRKIRIKWS